MAQNHSGYNIKNAMESTQKGSKRGDRKEGLELHLAYYLNKLRESRTHIKESGKLLNSHSKSRSYAGRVSSIPTAASMISVKWRLSRAPIF